MNTTRPQILGTGDSLEAALVSLGRGRSAGLAELAEVYDETVGTALRLALARTRGDLGAAEDLLVRAYCDVRRVAGEYPSSGIRALPWVLAVVARA